MRADALEIVHTPPQEKMHEQNTAFEQKVVARLPRVRRLDHSDEIAKNTECPVHPPTAQESLAITKSSPALLPDPAASSPMLLLGALQGANRFNRLF